MIFIYEGEVELKWKGEWVELVKVHRRYTRLRLGIRYQHKLQNYHPYPSHPHSHPHSLSPPHHPHHHHLHFYNQFHVYQMTAVGITDPTLMIIIFNIVLVEIQIVLFIGLALAFYCILPETYSHAPVSKHGSRLPCLSVQWNWLLLQNSAFYRSTRCVIVWL